MAKSMDDILKDIGKSREEALGDPNFLSTISDEVNRAIGVYDSCIEHRTKRDGILYWGLKPDKDLGVDVLMALEKSESDNTKKADLARLREYWVENYEQISKLLY